MFALCLRSRSQVERLFALCSRSRSHFCYVHVRVHVGRNGVRFAVQSGSFVRTVFAFAFAVGVLFAFAFTAGRVWWLTWRLAQMAGGKYLLAGLAWVARLAFDNTA